MIENVSGDGTLYQKYFVNMSNSCFAEGLRGKKRKRIRKKFEKNSCPKIIQKNTNIPQYQSNVYWSNQDDLNHDI